MFNSNPIISKLDKYQEPAYAEKCMTQSGTMNKLFLLALIMLIPAAISWNWFAVGAFDQVRLAMIAGCIVGFVLVLVMSFNPKSSPYLAPIYALAEGAMLGGLSATFEASFKGIVIQAIAVTFVAIFVMISLYKNQMIKVTEKFKSVMMTLIISIAVLYVTSIITNLLGFYQISSLIWTPSPISIGISIFTCSVASLSLLIDFDSIDKFSDYGAPLYMEWYCAFGLLVTIVWMYVEFLRLLSLLNRD